MIGAGIKRRQLEERRVDLTSDMACPSYCGKMKAFLGFNLQGCGHGHGHGHRDDDDDVARITSEGDNANNRGNQTRDDVHVVTFQSNFSRIL